MSRLFSAAVAIAGAAALHAQTVTESVSPSVPVYTADFDNAGQWPVGPTSVAALRSALPSLANFTLIPNGGPAGVYNTHAFHPGIGNQAGVLSIIGNTGTAPFEATNATLDFIGPITELGFGIGDWNGTMFLRFFLGGALIATHATGIQTGNVVYYQMSGGSFDRVEILPTSPGGNWLITDELTVQQRSNYIGPANLVFTMDGTVRLDCTTTGTTAESADEDSVLTFSPGFGAGPGVPFALPLVELPAWNAFFGDEDGDGNYTTVSAIGEPDGLHIVPGAPSPPGMFDVWISLREDIGPAGYLGADILDSDIFRLDNPGTGAPTGIVTYISEAQIILAGITGSDVDVDGFAIDSNNDLYLTFSLAVDVRGTTLHNGGIVLIPGIAQTVVGGVVVAVAPGSAQIVMTEADVDDVFVHAGRNGITDCSGIEIDPNGGTYPSQHTTFPVANLLLCDDDIMDDVIVSTIGGGTIAVVNGVAMEGGEAFGLDGSVLVGNPQGIAFASQLPTGRMPIVLDQIPRRWATPGAARFDGSGAGPGSPVLYAFGLGGVPVGGFYPRLSSLSAYGIPLISPSWLEFYPGIPVTASVLTFANSEGFTSVTLDITGSYVGFAIAVQSVDLVTGVFSSPVVTVTM